MKTLTISLIIASFVQYSVLPINLVLIILICRSYLRPDKTNFYLAFIFGLLDSHLNLTVLGSSSLIYLTVVVLVEGLARSRLAGSSFLIIPLAFILLLINQIILLYFTHQDLNFLKMFLESLIALPIFYLLKIWEERFIVYKDRKLKIR